jgi:hypothetical protein
MTHKSITHWETSARKVVIKEPQKRCSKEGLARSALAGRPSKPGLEREGTDRARLGKDSDVLG